MARKSYDECYDIIAKYANDMLPYFADCFNRFPDDNAVMIADYLNNRAQFYHEINEDIAAELENVADEIIERCG